MTAQPLTKEEVLKLRAETPGCLHIAHFNHAGASLMSANVLKTVTDHLQLEAEIGGYEAADKAEDRLEAVYASIARLINAQTDEIAVVENATRAWDMAFYGLPFAPGDRILTTASEYGSNVIACLQIAKRGVKVEVIPNDAHGQVDVDAFSAMLDDRVKVVAISHMPTNGGLLQPAAEIGAALKAANSSAVYILDACQTVGQLPIDVQEIGCHVLSATSRKYLRGPRGMGFLYVRRDVLDRIEPPFLDLHAARWVASDRYELVPNARRFENWEANIAAKLGMGAAIDEALAIGLDRIWATVQERADELRRLLRTIPGTTVQDLGKVKGGIVTFTMQDFTPEVISDMLRELGVNTVTSSINGARFDMEARGLPMVVRASVHYLTERGETGFLIQTLVRMLVQKVKTESGMQQTPGMPRG